MSTYLGFDCSTQSLSAIAIRVEGDRREVVFERSLRFDEAMPEYGTRYGVLPGSDPLVAVSPPAMWADALDRMMGTIASDGSVDLADVRAVAGSGQQHGSVYVTAEAAPRWASLDPSRALAPQLEGTFSRPVSPIWMDASTAAQCAQITSAVGGAAYLAQTTGSRAFERFTGPQVRKFLQEDPAGFARTCRVHLVSSFLASVLAGRHAPIDPGDGAGMNLMDLATGRWSAVAAHATGPGVLERLPAIAPSWTVVGPLSSYWQRRHGLPAAKVVAWSGDNPCSLVGTGLVRTGRIAISLGTSDTVFGYMPEPRVDASGTGHVFGAPIGGFMGLTCFRNGSLARERVKDELGLDWEGFSAALRTTRPGNGGAVMLPWFESEITPAVLTPGVRTYGLAPDDGPARVRAVVEGQMIAMARHSKWMGVAVDTIHATGGASANRDLLQVMADVFGAQVFQFEVGNSACLGAALRAYHADVVDAGRAITWDEVIEGFAMPVAASRVPPRREFADLYAALGLVHDACEAHALRGGDDPAPRLEQFRQRFA
jgi:xylulokinase